MKLEPIVMIHGGSIADTTSMSMSRACSTAPPNVPPSQKTIQTTRISVVCRASFIAAPKEPVPGYTLKQRSRTLIFAAFAALNYPGILLVWTPSGHISMFIRRAVNRGINMALRKPRDTVEHDQPAETEVEAEIREFVRRDVVTNRERQPENESEMVSINSVLQRATTTSVQEIDKLITELQTLRHMLHSKGAQVQREIVQYSTLTTAALHSTKIIAESLTQLKKGPDASTLSD